MGAGRGMDVGVAAVTVGVEGLAGGSLRVRGTAEVLRGEALFFC